LLYVCQQSNLSMPSSGKTLQEDLSIPKWNIKSDYIETAFAILDAHIILTDFQRYGFCRALVFFNIKEVILAMCNSTVLK
jgi:hypothetical protein